MFLRQKKNKSGSISIQIINKVNGQNHIFQSIGTSKDLNEIEKYLDKGKSILHTDENIQPLLFPIVHPGDLAVENFLETLENQSIRTVGPELIFGTVFDRIGYSQIPEELFRHIVLARLVNPLSKLKTVDYLLRYQNVITNEDAIYRFLDRLNKNHKIQVEKISYEQTKKVLKNISVVFYDMTTLYFETEDEDDLRKIGYSKDGKFTCPQIMIGLLVGEGGYPIGYDIYKGNTFEGHTLVPILKKVQDKYGFDKPVIIADSAMLSKKTLEGLVEQKYTFILGARIKNESEELKKRILEKTVNLKNGDLFELEKDGVRLIITYSDKRARKDAHNRDKGLKKLREKVKGGKLTKTAVTNRGYNKFLTLDNEISVSVDEEKINLDKSWDGLKGYVTNSLLTGDKVVENYSHLWQIEKAFRISKTDLRIRPIYHFKQRRIEAHICIAFVAYSIWKELERLLIEAKVEMTSKRAAELTQNIYEIEYTLPQSKKIQKRLLKLSPEQQMLYEVVKK